MDPPYAVQCGSSVGNHGCYVKMVPCITYFTYILGGYPAGFGLLTTTPAPAPFSKLRRFFRAIFQHDEFTRRVEAGIDAQPLATNKKKTVIDRCYL